VVCVEEYLLQNDIAGGQTDLCYKCPRTGEYVVVDLKTSSGLRQKHLLQTHAYGMLIENEDSLPVDEIGRYEVWRFSPEYREPVVHTDTAFDDVDVHDDSYFYTDSYGDYDYDGESDVRATFLEMARTAHIKEGEGDNTPTEGDSDATN